ncbi:MAG: 4-alpha-glucanotransferase [Thermoanaerobaculia bacterium]|nr:4-alpha-glucanotransferase [Thermoanaerobaculia bacterium]
MNPRKSGLILHPTSLPGPWGIGDLGEEAFGFLRWLEHAGQTLWQILPLGPTGMGNSPYGALSSFAGNPSLVSPRRLVEDGLLDAALVEHPPHLPEDHVDFGRAIVEKNRLLRIAWETFRAHGDTPLRQEFDSFRADEASWLGDWSLFRALKQRFGGREWAAWNHELASRQPDALDRARAELADELGFGEFEQWLFFRQWKRVREDANAKGIAIIGDVPIYVAFDSADVWANQHLFWLDDSGRPTVVAGVPPDYFSATGQLWGNPLYRWSVMKQDGYAWWIARVKANLRLADYIRLDHFRGFAGYWEVRAQETTAMNGRWKRGPGKSLFDAIRNALGELPLVAEDLGVITADVEKLRHQLRRPGMKILQFAFGDLDNPYAPHNHSVDSIVYTGTHDNDTTLGWFRAAPEWEKRRTLDYIGGDERAVHWTMIRAAMTSVARWAIAPAQDVFGLGSEGRMNRPGVASGNWGWRAHHGHFSGDAANRLRFLTELGGRLATQGTRELEQIAVVDTASGN